MLGIDEGVLVGADKRQGNTLSGEKSYPRGDVPHDLGVSGESYVQIQ